MATTLKTISPVDGSLYVERPLSSEQEIAKALEQATIAQAEWRQTSIAERAQHCLKAVVAFESQQDEIATELSWQMGRPIRYCPGEVAGFAQRARHMISIAEEKLSPIEVETSTGFSRYIKRDSLGVLFTIVPWNYPYLTAVNSIIPALMAGNAVIMKPSAQTPLTAVRLAAAFEEAGLPSGLFQTLFLDHQQTSRLVIAPEIDMVSFTGSVTGGAAIERAAAGRFIDINLELGGKDPAYVRADADLTSTVESLVDGAFFNSGQSCCGIERIYVQRPIYDQFIEAFVELARQYQLGHPLEPTTTLGPMVSTAAADWVRQQISEAVASGAVCGVDPQPFTMSKAGTAYLAPQVLLNVDHSQSIMRDESFGPVVGIMPVESDQQAVELMNDSEFGLTASVWTKDQQVAVELGEQVQTGTWFMNRCDYLDPALAWSGVKNSGRGVSLSEIAYERLTRPKSFHLKLS
jgi:acyl-CoA reductase-like NAD-dependent aldehyde dehydrogenase